MPAPSIDPGDLLDLKLMPAWVKEPSGREDYTHYQGEEPLERPDRPRARRRERDARGREQRPHGRREGRDDRSRPVRDGRKPSGHPRRQHGPPQSERRPPKPEQPLDVNVQFLPRPVVLENVIGQIKAETLAYSLFFLARSFLEKPQRYEVGLKGKPESPFYRLGETGTVGSDRNFIESNAFRLGREQFYTVEVTQAEPLKGNFTSIARDRLSGTIFGPTNHHDYQRKLRALYEQRFSRRMSFPQYQHQIEIVSDPAAVEQWKEEARNVTMFVTRQDPPVTFHSEAEAERDFRQNHLPGLVQTVEEALIDGVSSRQLPDRKLRRHVEEAWSAEYRSPSHMLQELAKRFRDAGLHIFRHRRGMLFVSSIRVRPFVHDEQSVSPQVKAILELITASPRVRRKEVADKLLAEAGEDADARKLALAADLKWLISEGYLIEFNDGALDLPRSKTPNPKSQTPDLSEAPSSEPQAPGNVQSPISKSAETSLVAHALQNTEASTVESKPPENAEDDPAELGFA